jgi:hypothetical protein
MRAKNVLIGAVLAIAIGAPIVGFVGDIKMAQRTNGECAEELGGEGVPESHPLQQPPQKYAFATALFVSDARATFRSLRAA